MFQRQKGEKMKVLLSKVSLLGATALLTISAANAQYHTPQVKQVAHRVNQYMHQGSRIDVSQAFRRGVGYNEKIVSIRVVAQSSSHNAKMILKSGYQNLDSVSLDGFGPKTLRVPQYVNTNSLKLVVRGSAFVERVVAQVSSVYGGGQGQGQGQNQVLKAHVDIQTTRAGALLPVKQLVRNQTNVQLNNKNIKAVVLKAQSSQSAMAQVLVNGRQVGSPVYLSYGMQRQVINLRGVNTRGANIKLKITGRAKIQMVGLKL